MNSISRTLFTCWAITLSLAAGSLYMGIDSHLCLLLTSLSCVIINYPGKKQGVHREVSGRAIALIGLVLVVVLGLFTLSVVNRQSTKRKPTDNVYRPLIINANVFTLVAVGLGAYVWIKRVDHS